MRRPIKSSHVIVPDEKYDSELLSRFINTLMLDGKKSTARKTVYRALDEIKERDGSADPLAVFEMAIQNVSPSIETRSRRVGGANYQIPTEVRPDRRRALAFRWILKVARSSKGKPIVLSTGFSSISDVHKQAEANRAFAHLAW